MKKNNFIQKKDLVNNFSNKYINRNRKKSELVELYRKAHINNNASMIQKY